MELSLAWAKNLLYPFLIFLISLAIYSPSINSPLISDESYFIQRNQVSSLAETPSLFNKKDYDGYYYRPLPNFISGVSALIFHYNVRDYRILNIILHAIASILIYYFFYLLLVEYPNKNLIALFAAAFFAAFPIHDYAVIWITDLFERVMIIFYMAGLIAFVRNRYKPGLLSILFFILSLFSKEMAFSFPLTIGLIYFYFGEKRFSFKKSITAILPYLAIMAAFILIRIIIFNNDVFTAKDAHSTATLIDVIKNYFIFSGLLIFPFFLRDAQSFLLMHKLLASSIGILFLIAILLLFFKTRKKDYTVIFFVLFIILTIAPASRLMMRWYLYLPSVGFTGLLSYLIFTANYKSLKTPLFIAISFLFIYSFALIHAENDWIKNSNESIMALKDFIRINKNDIDKSKRVEFLTIPAKIDDTPVFQLAFDKLFNFYYNSSSTIKVEVDSKSYLSNFYDSIYLNKEGNGLELEQINNNYFILYNNGKNINFAGVKYRNNQIRSLLINKMEFKNKILYTFSNGKFYKLKGIE